MLNAQKLDALNNLIATVEVGRLSDASVWHGSLSIRDHWSYSTGINAENRRNIYLVFNGSLDAALALHNALLPGWEWSVSWVGASVGGPNAHPAETPDVEVYADNSKTPARAWLLAILKAYRAQVEKEG